MMADVGMTSSTFPEPQAVCTTWLGEAGRGSLLGDRNAQSKQTLRSPRRQECRSCSRYPYTSGVEFLCTDHEQIRGQPQSPYKELTSYRPALTLFKTPHTNHRFLQLRNPWIHSSIENVAATARRQLYRLVYLSEKSKEFFCLVEIPYTT
jgi:protein gp37